MAQRAHQQALAAVRRPGADHRRSAGEGAPAVREGSPARGPAVAEERRRVPPTPRRSSSTSSMPRCSRRTSASSSRSATGTGSTTPTRAPPTPFRRTAAIVRRLIVERARLAEAKKQDFQTATELYKAALALDPRASGALPALKRLHTTHRRWGELVSVLELEAQQANDPALARQRLVSGRPRAVRSPGQARRRDHRARSRGSRNARRPDGARRAVTPVRAGQTPRRSRRGAGALGRARPRSAEARLSASHRPALRGAARQRRAGDRLVRSGARDRRRLRARAASAGQALHQEEAVAGAGRDAHRRSRGHARTCSAEPRRTHGSRRSSRAS